MNYEEEKLSLLDAYRAMFEFLNIQYELSNDITVSDLLSFMSLLPDGKPADSAMWEDWIDALKRSKENPDNINFTIIE